MRKKADPFLPSTTDGDIRWRRRYALLRAFVETYGRLPNAAFSSAEERQLRSWCSTQRNAFHGLGTAPMTDERTALLEQIPHWEW